MDADEVKCVAGHHDTRLVRVGGPETGIVIVQPGQVAPDLVLLADIADVILVGNAVVQFAVKAGMIRAVEPGRRTDAVEIVHHRYQVAIAPDGPAGAEHLGRETLAALVEGDDPPAVQLSGLDGETNVLEAVALVRVDHGPVVEGTVAQTRLQQVAGRFGCRFGRIVRGPPAKGDDVAVQLGGEISYREGLDHVVKAVAFAQELQHSFINGTANGESEHRVQAVFHIGKILVGKQLQQHAGHAGGAGLAIGTVP